jgi:PPOX class probable F420-dependent enzyme
MSPRLVLTARQRAFLLEARRIVMCTIAPDGSPRPVPICFALVEDVGAAGLRIYTPLDEKPKLPGDPRNLARVRDILARPAVTLLADRWDEDWTNLGWLRLHGQAALIEPPIAAPSAPGHGAPPAAAPLPGPEVREHAVAVAALRARYAQYAGHDIAGHPIIRIELVRAISWGRLG